MEPVRRLVDVAVAVPALAIATPLTAMVGIAIRARSPGPFFFSQERPGSGGRHVRVHKLRTLHVDAEQRLAQCLATDPAARRRWERERCLASDPRVAGLAGRLARRYGIDELPQLWNVLRGEMTLIGPRPLESTLLDSLFSPEERAHRQSVTPGLTGLWQVRRRVDSTLSLRRYDLFYLQRRSLAFDLWILWQTPRALARGAGG